MKSIPHSEYQFNFSALEVTNLLSALHSVASRWPMNAGQRAQALYDRLHGRVSLGAEGNERGLTAEGRAA